MQEVTDRGGTANFGLLRDPSFLGPRMGDVMLALKIDGSSKNFFLIQFAKNEETGRTRRAPKKRVPEEGENGCSSMPCTF